MDADTNTIRGIDHWSRTEAVTLLHQLWKQLPDHGILTVEVLDWDWVVQRGMLSDEENSMLFSIQRRSTWNALMLVKALGDAGFYKVWTGHVPELPEHMFLAKALKVVKIPELT